jgi:hypothetical protein
MLTLALSLDLTTLHLREVDFNPDDLSPTFSLSAIRRLSIAYTGSFEWSLLERCFPSLTTLLLDYAPFDTSEFLQYWHRIAPRLITLSISDSLFAAAFPVEALTLCTSLLHFRKGGIPARLATTFTPSLLNSRPYMSHPYPQLIRSTLLTPLPSARACHRQSQH